MSDYPTQQAANSELLEMMHIALAVHDPQGSYYRQALTTIVSVFANTKRRVTLHLLHDDSLLQHLHEFKRVADDFSKNAVFYNMDHLENIAVNLDTFDAGKWGKGALYRLLIPSILAVPKVLYLDCDIICTLDIAEIFQADIGGKLVGVVNDYAALTSSSMPKYLKNTGFDQKRYFNTGVMLFNLEQFRDKAADFWQSVIKNLNNPAYKYPDQDALNKYFVPETIFYMDYKFNVELHHMDFSNREFSWYQNKILHFTTANKPWTVFSPAAILYWSYYALVFSTAEAFAGMEKTRLNAYAPILSCVMRSRRLRSLCRRYGALAKIFNKINIFSNPLQDALEDRLTYSPDCQNPDHTAETKSVKNSKII